MDIDFSKLDLRIIALVLLLPVVFIAAWFLASNSNPQSPTATPTPSVAGASATPQQPLPSTQPSAVPTEDNKWRPAYVGETLPAPSPTPTPSPTVLVLQKKGLYTVADLEAMMPSNEDLSFLGNLTANSSSVNISTDASEFFGSGTRAAKNIALLWVAGLRDTFEPENHSVLPVVIEISIYGASGSLSQVLDAKTPGISSIGTANAGEGSTILNGTTGGLGQCIVKFYRKNVVVSVGVAPSQGAYSCDDAALVARKIDGKL